MSKEVNEERTPRTVEDVKEMLTKHSNGEIQRTIQNCITILQNDHVLADAFRAVGIPSRVAGTPAWHDDRGNHNWNEVWVDGKWRFTEYYPQAGIDGHQRNT